MHLLPLRAALAALLLGSLAAAAACDGDDPGARTGDEQHDTEDGRLLLLVTVDWEGRDLREENLAAMERLRERFPDVKLVHFLNAAYFTKDAADAADVRERIARTLSPGDELGLHVHGWKSLFEASGVTFRDAPTFWDPSGRVTDCWADCGHEVPISAYDVDELRAVLRFSVDTLEEAGFGRATSFRAGGWMAAPHVREALAAEGFTTENSAVPSELLASEIGHLPLHDWVEELWPDTTTTSQPERLATDEHGHILEIPDNGALADYMTADEMIAVYDELKAVRAENPRRDVVLSIGFHQETAARYLSRVEAALEHVIADAEAEGLPLRSATAEEIASDP